MNPNYKILTLFKLKAFTDDKLDVTPKLKFGMGKVENILGNGENAGCQCSLLFLQCFQRPSFSGLLEVGIM